MSEEEKKQEETKAKQEETKEETKEEKKQVEVPEKFKSLVSEIEKMSVLDLAELVKILEDKFGVSAAAPVAAVATTAPGADDGQATEEKDSFDVELTELGSDKIAAIKVVREVTELSLKDAKEMVESAPKVIKEAAKKEEAEELKKKLEDAGCKVTLK